MKYIFDNGKFVDFEENKIWQIFNKKNKINYYQTVNTKYGKSVDDVMFV